MSREEAHEALEAAIRAYASEVCDGDDIVTDAVLVFGAQYINSDGDRSGRVFVFPRLGHQPPYITVGLLECARRLVDKALEDEGA